MIITYRTRRYIDKCRCKTTLHQIFVKKLAFVQGDLLYYKKNDFEYFTIAKEDIVSIEQ